MSDENPDTDGEPLYTADSVSALLREHYHVPVLGAVLAFMLWVRMASYDRFTRGGDVLFSGNDAWYHLREVSYIAEHWPRIMPFDPWSYFPFGTNQGQFGTLYDQLVATGAVAVGLGDPSARTVALSLLVAPAVFGTLTAIPVYYVTKRLEGRLAGVFAAVVIAVLPGTFLTRSLVGSADHNAVEPLFQTLGVLATMVALTVAARERPVWEQAVDRDLAGLREPLAWSAVAGVALAVYMWVWPPGVLLVGILGVFYVLKLTTDVLRGTSPEHTAFVAVVSMLVAGLLMLVPLSSVGVSPTQFSLLQVFIPFAVAGGAGVLAAIGRVFDRRQYARQIYPVAVLGLAVLGLGVFALALPSVWSLVQNNLFRFIGFNAGAQQRTIIEAAPWLSQGAFVPQAFGQYGLALFTALLGCVYLLDDVARSDELTGDRLLVLVWFAFILAAAFTQVRFNYYLAVPIAVLNGVLFLRTVSHPWFGDLRAGADVNPSHALVAFAVILLVVAPLATGVGGSGLTVRSATAVGQNSGPGGYTGWQDSLNWMEEHTPQEGNYGGAGNVDQLQTYGTYAPTDDFDYPAGSYGVMSWWDYGHWLTVGAERIPTANPFQQGATTAANYLLAPNATAASESLETVAEDDAETRYVAVDWQMVSTSSKFGAPTIFYDRSSVTSSDFRKVFFSYSTSQQRYRQSFFLKHQRYYESMMVRLYRFHGSRAEPNRFVIDWAQNYTQGGANYLLGPQGNQSIIRQFNTTREARQYVRNDSTSQIGGLADLVPKPVPALEHYRMVRASPNSGPQNFRTSIPAYVKIFERVPGATVEGQAPPNTTVTATVPMNVTSRQNATFTYEQQAEVGPDGTFTMTLPYSTTGYDAYGTDAGYTDVSVRANGVYTFSGPMQFENGSIVSYRDTANVTEGQVLGEDSTPVSVSLTKQNVSLGGLGDRRGPSSAGTATHATGADTGGTDGTTTQTDGVQADGEQADATAARTAPSALATLVGATVLSPLVTAGAALVP